jgi:hypothetical protein
MDLAELFDRARNLYFEAFKRFVELHASTCQRGGAEMIFQVPEPSDLYRGFARIDFVKNDERLEAMWVETDTLLTVESGAASVGSMALRIEALRWDNLVIHHDFFVLPEAEVAAWFERWFDPDDARYDPNAAFGTYVHSLCVMPGVISTDLGSAPTEALWQMLELIERAGAKAVTINDQVPTSH